ncbi:AraC family transcriptional regulator [Cupriavidus sp. TA19]|uniref:helix-turn-helix transcriptional regulator n=1 Tax=unclassified Cupriavidus TaxID=2640874 RepID=UPI000E2ED8ED|nr:MULTISPECIES: helix-turn-helix transcriptional regulator [unclassified Cupriavidus]BDB28816.1 helix-turn-helix domain-containing protein [Cupriavidus sp. P-10]GLC92811.1 AraC family transcriptional regulator [Cupriavidus sp. TA19]
MTTRRRGSGAKLFGTGRIVLWRGGSVWIGRAEEKADSHAHHAIQVTLALSGGAVRFQTPGQDWAAYTAAMISAHQPHAFEAPGELVALIFTEPESREGRMLRERFRTGIAPLAPDIFTDQAAALTAAYDAGATDEELTVHARAVIARLTLARAVQSRLLDKRIEHAIEVLRKRIGETVSMAEIADAVHLSPERFRHLFLEETGIRFRPYVLWLRLELAIASYAAGKSLTDAAYAGGFADSAHLSRTFKRMFGVLAGGISVQRV